MSKNTNLPKTSQIDGIDQIGQIGQIGQIDGISWSDLSHRARSLISIDCEPNFVRAMLDRAVLTLSEDQIIEIEDAIKSCDEDIAKDVIYSQFINCIFDDVHIDEIVI